MKSLVKSTLGLCATVVFSTQQLFAIGLIDFEALPGGGVPTDNTVLNVPYNLPGGGTVQFYFDRNANFTYDAGIDADPILEAYGADGSDGFANGLTTINDTANGGLASQLGNFFLRQTTPGSVPDPFIIDYNTLAPIPALSGEIWDIDGGFNGMMPNSEQWLVQVLDSSNTVLASQLSPLGISPALDGLPWTFAFSSLPAGVDKVSITFTGTKTFGLGLAFNNFSPVEVPEPSSMALLAIVLCVAGRVRKATLAV